MTSFQMMMRETLPAAPLRGRAIGAHTCRIGSHHSASERSTLLGELGEDWRGQRGQASLANSPSGVANLSMRVLSRFLAAATDAAQFPVPTLPEIAFLGRSNVGKSSVINSLVGTKLARTSSTPGRTRSINFFEIRWPGKPRPELIFADLPGYGYAKISREISQEWPKFIEPYLNDPPTRALCFFRGDATAPPQQSARQLLAFLSPPSREFLIVATKSDKL